MAYLNDTEAVIIVPVVDGEVTEDDNVPWWVWFGLICCALVSSWCQARLAEERFVPSLNVIANYFQIPDDVAGATIMAAGVSSPDIFSNIVALFITHTAMGLGTIFGAIIFNQLVICAGVTLAARGGQLRLDKLVFAREVGFFTISIFLLLYALSDRRQKLVEEEGPAANIYITLLGSSIMFGGYVIYVVVCSNFDGLIQCCFPSTKEEKEEDQIKKVSKSVSKKKQHRRNVSAASQVSAASSRSRKCSISLEVIPDMPFFQHEPRRNFHKEDSIRSSDIERSKTTQNKRTDYSGSTTTYQIKETRADESTFLLPHALPLSGSYTAAKDSYAWTNKYLNYLTTTFSDDNSQRAHHFRMEAEKPSDTRELEDIEESIDSISCFLWQRSRFYDKARCASRGWQLRWFTFGYNTVTSVPDRVFYNEHRLTYRNFDMMEIDPFRLIIHLKNSSPTCRDYFLLAPSTKVFEAVTAKCEMLMEVWDTIDTEDALGAEIEVLSDISVESISEEETPDIDDEWDESANAVSFIEVPYPASLATIIFFIILFPLNLLLHLTIPDVRLISPARFSEVKIVTYAFTACTSCLVWIIAASYCMVASLEELADLLNIPDSIMGTFMGAMGVVSIPNFFAARAAARQGFGNMAVSNVFGSNTFNLLVGLGLPWLFYTAFCTNGEPYSDIRDHGITLSVVIIGAIAAIISMLVILNNFVLVRWHATLFFVLYGMYLLYIISQICIGGFYD